MGFFGGSTTYVASVVYNLAGDETKRVNFLKTIVVGNVLTDSKFSVADTVSPAYRTGPGIKARSFYRWAEENYSHIGIPPMIIGTSSTTDFATVQPLIPVVDGEYNTVTALSQGFGDITYWAEDYILATLPARINEPWTVTWPGSGLATITFPPLDPTYPDTTTVTFTPADPLLVQTEQYLYVKYNRFLTADNTLVRADVWIYKFGSGNTTLDALHTSSSPTANHFFPYIPLRYANVALSTSHYPEAYALSKIAYKKATGGDYDELLATIEENPNIGDIDRAYVVFGVPMNTKDKSAKKYIYEFFDYIRGLGTINYVQILSPGETPLRLDIVISWISLVRVTGTGLAKPTAVVGEYWMVSPPDDGQEKLWIYHQITSNSWESLEIMDLKMRNNIHNGEAVNIDADEAIVDPEESGFFIPLHWEILRGMSLKDSTQICTCSTLIVFNCQETVKTPWYATDAFKVVLFIVMVAIIVVTAGTAAPAVTAGYAAIGTAIGLTGLAAVIAGAIISQLAAMILMRVVALVSTELFGEKWAAIITTVVAVAMIIAGPQLMGGQPISAAWSNMASAANIIALSNAVGQGIAGYIQASAMEVTAETAEVTEKYKEESSKIAELYEQNIGYGNGMIDPMMLTNFLSESQASFLGRTLLTGSDIAEMSMDMVTNFANYTISTKL